MLSEARDDLYFHVNMDSSSVKKKKVHLTVLVLLTGNQLSDSTKISSLSLNYVLADLYSLPVIKGQISKNNCRHVTQ